MYLRIPGALLGGALVALALASPSQAQCAPHWSATFGVPGASGGLARILVWHEFDDGSGGGTKLYAGGSFTSIGGVAANNIACWDGSSWSPLGAGTNGQVRSLAVFNGELIAGGCFNQPGTGVARWNGSFWQVMPGPNGGNGVSGCCEALEVFDDGTGPALYTGGNTNYAGGSGGVPVDMVARWDGFNWSAVGSGLNAVVFSLRVHDDGSGPQLYAGGSFTVPGSKVARWNGASWSAVGPGTSGNVYDVLAFDDGVFGPALFAGGGFTMAGGAPAANIARWDGASWSPLGSGMNGPVNDLAIHDDGVFGPSLYACGGFTVADGDPTLRVARWAPGGWEKLSTGLTNNADSMASHDDGSGLGTALYVGGAFSEAGGLSSERIARYDLSPDAPLIYCTAKVNSLGCTPSIGFAGAPSVGAGLGFTISAMNVLSHNIGILIYSTAGPASQPFQGGTMCLKGTVKRTGALNSGGGPPPTDCSGAYSFDFNAWIAGGTDPALVPGQYVWAQFWSRDLGFPPPNYTGLTNALRFLLCP